MSASVSFQQALKNMAVICSKSEKCSSDLITELKKSDLTEDDIAKIIDYLKKEKYIDDQRYAHHFVSEKFRLNKWGKIKITFMLRQKHIDNQIIENSLAVIPEEDYERTLREILRGKAKSIKGSGLFERRGKLALFAQGRGFESDIAFRIAGEILSGSEYR